MTKTNKHTHNANLHWSDALSLNNEKIDEQHKHLYALTNRLIDESKGNPEVLNDTLYQLLQYIENHFKDEEILLKKRGYPYLEEHKRVHRTFLRKIAMFCKDDVDGKPKIEEELYSYLSLWLLTHIEKTDQEYKDYI